MTQGRIKRTTQVRLPEIGRIKVGERSENGLPRSLDYFRPDGIYRQYFTETFGERPSAIEIVFLSDDMATVCNERYEMRVGKKLYAYGDGEVFRVWSEEKEEYLEYNMGEHAEFIRGLAKACKSKWETVLSLSFAIPKIRQIFGVWRFVTKADKTTIPQIVSTLDTVKDIAGTIVGIPFDLVVEKVTSQKPGSKNSYPVVKIVPNVSQGHLERVRQFVDAGMDFHRMLLTEDRIEKIGYNEKIMGGVYENDSAVHQK